MCSLCFSLSFLIKNQLLRHDFTIFFSRNQLNLINIVVQKMIPLTFAANFIPHNHPTLKNVLHCISWLSTTPLIIQNKHTMKKKKKSWHATTFTKHSWFSSFQLQVSKERGALEMWSATRDTEQLETAKSQPNQPAQLLAL